MDKKCFAPGVQFSARYMVDLCEAEPPVSWLYEDLCGVVLLPRVQISDERDAIKVLGAAAWFFDHLQECETCGMYECPEPLDDTREWYRNYHMHAWAHMKLEALGETISASDKEESSGNNV